MSRRVAPVILASLVLVPSGHAATTLGLYGEPGRFRDLTGQRTVARHMFIGWNSTYTRIARAFRRKGPVPLFAFKPRISPRAVARGLGDRNLIRFSLAAHRHGRRAYLRPFPEMNGHWTSYCAYNRNGTRRGRSHSQRAFKNAFRRTYVILKGGSRAEMNARLRRFGLPGVRRSLPESPHVRVIWNPQGFGSPNVPGNMPAAYWPGPGFVDVVGNDLYYINGRAMWQAAHALYRRYPMKPYAFPEWGLWGRDAPAFVRRMARFVRAHPRVELIAWYNGNPGSIWDIKSKPASRRAYRRSIVPLAR